MPGVPATGSRSSNGRNTVRLSKVVTSLLIEKGFHVSVYKEPVPRKRYCFNITAKRGDKFLLIKCVERLERFTSQLASELKITSFTFGSTPLVVALKDSDGKPLLEGILYKKYKVFGVEPSTLRILLEERGIYIYADKGGFHVKINGKKLRKLRERLNLSLGEVAEAVGVSRKAIYEYERGNLGSTPEVAVRLEELLGGSIVKPINIFEETHYRKESDVQYRIARSHLRKMPTQLHEVFSKEIGDKIKLLRQAPFEIIVNKDKRPLIVKLLLNLRRKREQLKELEYSIDFSKMADAQLVLVSNKASSYEIKKSEINSDELLMLSPEDAKELKELLEE
ncbi:MAG: helix-turn-helix domain-containing protein [Thermoproteales archaeon]|nr:helix-turn-helix domain-containing protein [Thermoproteales archaeon]RLE65872.1 MAG: hypothetical protein DRJ47_03860 [Thermoprotei archaeon]